MAMRLPSNETNETVLMALNSFFHTEVIRLHNGNALEYLGQAIAHHRQGLTTPMLQGIG
jgi:hypothetical protein